MSTIDNTTTTYIPSDEALKFIAFVRATGNEENTSPEVHYKIADALFSSNKKDWNLVIECTRGLGKSTTLEYALIYVAALGHWPNFGKSPFIVFLGASLEGNVKAFFKNVQSKVENSDFLRALLKIPRCVDNEIELVNNDGHETIITGRGMGTNWRGIRSKRGDRPSVLVADDILPSEVMTSEALRATIEMNWFNSALPALNPIKHKIVYIGTPLSDADLLHKLKNSGEYRIERYPLCSKFPCEEHEYDSVWPDRFSYEYAMKMYNQFKSAGKAQSFYCEYLLDVTDLSTLLVEEDDVRWYEPKLLIKNKHLYNFYISTDFATSEKKSADYSTIGVWAVGSDGSWFLVDGQCKRQSMMDNLEDLFRYAHKWKPLSVGIESSGQQGGFLSIINEMMMEKNIWFTLAKKRGSKEFGIRPTKDKTSRFVTGVQPMFKQGKVWLPKPELIKDKVYLMGLVDELVNELSKFTLAGGVKALAHDDCVSGDTLVTMGNGMVKPISEIVVGDMVMTFDIDLLTQPVERVIVTGIKDVSTYVFSDGTELTMTDNHPVLTTAGYIPAELLTSKDEVISWSIKSTQEENGQRKNQDTTKALQCFPMVEESGCTNSCGKRLTAGNLKDSMYTIKTEIKTITNWKIWNYSQQVITQLIMGSKETWRSRKSIWKKLDPWLMSGIKPKSVGNGQKKTSNVIEKKCLSTMIKNADGAESPLKLDSVTGLPTAIEPASFKQYKQMLLDRKHSLVSGVEVRSSGTEKRQDVAKNAAIIYLCEKKGRKSTQTYNLEVVKTHNFLANGVVVHNCLDLLNQLSEMDTITPDNGLSEDGTSSVVTDDGLIWTGEFDEPYQNYRGGSTIF